MRLRIILDLLPGIQQVIQNTSGAPGRSFQVRPFRAIRTARAPFNSGRYRCIGVRTGSGKKNGLLMAVAPLLTGMNTSRYVVASKELMLRNDINRGWAGPAPRSGRKKAMIHNSGIAAYSF